MSIFEGLTEGSFNRSTAKRLPIVFCLDVSGSMLAPTKNGTPRIQELNEAFWRFIDTMKENAEVAAAADIGILTFGGVVEVVQNMIPITELPNHRILVRERSLTPLGECIQAAIYMLNKRKAAYKEQGKKYYQPWLVVLTDGEPEGDGALEAMEEAIRQTNELEREKKLTVFNVAISPEEGFPMLKRLSIMRPEPIQSDAENLNSFFEFLGSSSSAVVDPSQPVPPDLNSMQSGLVEALASLDEDDSEEINLDDWDV